ncbi:MAG: SMC-Scp complex subunit ScpB [Planctomycetota bacterium]|jgi:segregation and condensation protein B|nr:SMC-Scp complex subunit ScpB [Planctomycetota bacterium]
MMTDDQDDDPPVADASTNEDASRRIPPDPMEVESASNSRGSNIESEGFEDEGEEVSEAESESEPHLPLGSIVEAVLFAAREALKPVQIARAVGTGIRQSAVKEAISELNLHYLETARAFEIAEISGRFQLMSRPEFAEHLMRLYPKRELSEKPGAQRLTSAALDTLSIIAYKQPVTRAEIERIRGVGCGPVLRSLIERGTIRISGKLEVVGKPPLYGTTEAFLVEFGLGSLDELPLRNDFLNAFPEPDPRVVIEPMASPGEETASPEEIRE